MSKSMRVSVEVDVHSVTCPGVWFPCKSPVYLSICFLGFHVKTKPFPAAFPLLFGDKFVFEKTFPGTSTLQHLQATLEGQPLYVELLQEVNPGHAPGSQTVLATFETSGLEFLFPYPQLRPTYTSGVDVDLLMEPTRDFPGVISPKIEASTRTHINETRHAHLDQLHDNALTLNGIPPMDKHPHIPPCNTRPHSSLEEREPFCWRKVDEELIDRKPSAHLIDAPPPPPPHGPHSPPPHMYHTPEVNHFRSRSRSLPKTPPGGHHSRPRSRSRAPHPGPPGHHGPHRHRSPSAGPHLHPATRDYYPGHHPVQPPAPPPPLPGPPPPVVRPHTPHTPSDHVPMNPHPLPHHGPFTAPTPPPHGPPPVHPSHSHSHWPVPQDHHCHSRHYPPPPPYHHPYHVDNLSTCMANCYIDSHPHFPTLPASQPHLHSRNHCIGPGPPPPPPPGGCGSCCNGGHCC